eukprot:929257-Rhodomonas_salina.1
MRREVRTGLCTAEYATSAPDALEHIAKRKSERKAGGFAKHTSIRRDIAFHTQWTTCKTAAHQSCA